MFKENKVKKILSLIIVFSMIFIEFAGIYNINSYALDIGETKIDEIRYIKNHSSYNVSGGNLIILGSKLNDKDIYFDVNGVPEKLGTLSSNSSTSILNYELNANEVNQFSGIIYVGSTSLSLGTPDMPYISGANVLNVNQDKNETIIINGAKLDNIDGNNYTATYGKGISVNNIVSGSAPNSPNSYTFIPKAPGQLGFQDIKLGHVNNTSNPKIKITYNYLGAFRILENLDLDPIQMYPNSAGRGDFIVLKSDNFKSADKYRVYFLELSDNDFAFQDYKMSPDIVLSQDGKRLSVQIPKSQELELGAKKVIVCKISNDEIIARFNLNENFNLIDASFQPIINKINPNIGSDEGAAVQLIGRNLIKPNISGLAKANGEIPVKTAKPLSSNEKMHIEYDVTGVSFRGEPVTELYRDINVIISKPASFKLNPDGTVFFSQIGAEDYLYINTAIIDDVGNDPVKDVLVESFTVIKTASGTYNFNHSAIEPDGFTFIESSVEPKIESVSPELIQISPSFKLKETMLISISGDNFMVNKYTDSSGILRTNLPIVQFQSGTQLGDSEYIAKFDPNDTSGTLSGTIYNPKGEILKNSDGEPISVNLTVLNKENKIVDGSKGNEIGQRIILYVPKELSIFSGGKKNIQIINPKRESNSDGKAIVGKDLIFFVKSENTPVISSVEPGIVTINSFSDVLIKGSNFQEGVKVFIDGEEIQGVDRQIDAQGTGMTLSFKTPKGRVGKTQLQVLNPEGGLAVRDFYYIKSFGQDPSLNSISPEKGTIDTLVVVKGDNFFKPDPATETDKGLDIYRLIGTRVYLDGKDVNLYKKNSIGEIILEDYSSPASEPILKISNSKVSYSDYYKNTLVTNEDGTIVYSLNTDKMGNPIFFDGNHIKYVFKAKSGNIYAYDSKNNEVGVVTLSNTSVNVSGGENFKVKMDNKLLGAKKDQNQRLYSYPADYHNAVILEDQLNKDFYTLVEDLDKSIKLSNGKKQIFKIYASGNTLSNPNFKAKSTSGELFSVTVNETGLIINSPTPINLKMKTAYIVENGRITGKRADVYTKDEIRFSVPSLNSGSGLKDVELVNPDTKSAKLEKSFYYYHLPASRPVISSIIPNRGSVDGGYLITINGRDFKESTQVYIGGILVPPVDKQVDVSGETMEVKVPKYQIDLNTVFGIGEITVPVVVVNSDGATAQQPDGFTYVKPASTPVIKKIILNNGSSNGGEVVEIIGEDFRFFEPYLNNGGGLGYDEGIDIFTNLNNHLPVNPKWDNLTESRYDGSTDLWEAKPFGTDVNYYGYDKYYDSKILPSVYFGNRKAKIVEFSKDYLKVISPVSDAGTVDVVVTNNDSGVSNKVKYTYNSSKPVITYINPSVGARIGDEKRDIVGSGFTKARISAYQNNIDSSIIDSVDKIDAMVRFGDLSNQNKKIGEENDGRINANHAIVNIEGGLRVSYNGTEGSLNVSLEEGGEIYSRKFTSYDGRDVFIPTGMLKKGSSYYVPFGYDRKNSGLYNTETDYELIRVRIDREEKRLIVERAYAPVTYLEGTGKISLKTPSYYTIGQVNVYIFNPDGGFAVGKFEYTNPASKPLIESAKPLDIIPANSAENKTNVEQRMIQASVQGGAKVEITGRDIREGAKLYFGTTEIKILEIEQDNLLKTQTIIAEVPAGSDTEISEKKPVIIVNKDGGTAVSNDINTLGVDKRLMYFIYRKPLSLPVINEVIPKRTSQYGGNIVEIKGSDFRKGSKVVIGSKGGLSLTPITIDEFGKSLTFQVPSGLSPGSKDIQVVNSDFGTVTLKDGLKIISYPTINNKITDKDGKIEVSVVSTEGGDVITLKGDNFTEGAKVYFGGKRKISDSKDSTGVKGFYRDDNIYILSDYIEAKSVEFVDKNTLKVYTPEINKEKDYTITVINADEGISAEGIKLRFSLPRPSASSSLKAEIIDDKYIKLFDYKSDKVDYYTIYAYLGGKSKYELKNNRYRDFKALTTTSYEPFKITRLEGFTELQKNEKAYFLVKGVNSFGSSEYSNIAELEYKDIKKVKSLGENYDKKGIYNNSNNKEKYVKESHGEAAKIVFPEQSFKGDVNINIGTENSLENSSTLLFPKKFIDNYKNVIRLNTPISFVNVNPSGLGTKKYYDFWKKNGGYGNMILNWKEDYNTSSAKSRLPKNLKTVSPVMKLDFIVKKANREIDISPIKAPVKFGVKLSAPEITEGKGKIFVYRYDLKTRSWYRHKGAVNGKFFKFDADMSGYYVLVQGR